MSIEFLKNFVKKPHVVGALTPSSKYLAAEILRHLPENKGDVIVEYGPGTGSFSSVLHDQLSGQRSLALEIINEFIPNLQGKYPKTEFIHASADELKRVLDERNLEPAKLILSGLPWAIFKEELQDRILKATYNHLDKDGYFSTFGYLHALKLPAAQQFHNKIQNIFSTVKKSKVVWKNIPPAIVYHCKK